MHHFFDFVGFFRFFSAKLADQAGLLIAQLHQNLIELWIRSHENGNRPECRGSSLELYHTWKLGSDNLCERSGHQQ